MGSGPVRRGRRQLLHGLAGLVGAAALAPRAQSAGAGPSLTLYNWETYIGRNTLAEFERRTGIEVRSEYFANNEDLVRRISAGNHGCDVIVPSSEAVEALIRTDLLLPLDRSALTNIGNIDRQLRDALFDRGRKHSVPYTWGTVGIGYRRSAMPEPVGSWKVLYESDTLAGRISLLDDAAVVIGCGLKCLGYSYNSVEPAELDEIERLLVEQKKNIRIFAPDTGQDLLAGREVDACQEYNGDIAQLMTGDADISYDLPVEGSYIWQDSLCIPADAPNPAGAHAFINFVLEPEVGKDIAETIQYATPNAAARALMDSAYLNNPAIFPPAEYIARCEPALYLGEEGEQLRAEVWARIQAA